MPKNDLIHQIDWTPIELTSEPLSFKKILFVVADIDDNEDLPVYQKQLEDEGFETIAVNGAGQMGRYLSQDTIVVQLPPAAKIADKIHETAVRSCNGLVAIAQSLRKYSQSAKHSSCKLFSLIPQDCGFDALGYAPLHGLARVLKMEIPDLFGGLFEAEKGKFPLAALQHAQGFDFVRVVDNVPQSAALKPSSDHLIEQKQMTIQPGASYLITGGTRGMGLEIAGWIADRGAGNIVLVSRHGGGNEPGESGPESLQSCIRSMEVSGSRIHIVKVDVGKPGAQAQLAEAVEQLHIPAIKGVVHAAGVAEYNTLDRCPPSDMAAVLAPKIAGGLALHELFPPGELDFFILTSSFGQLVGFPGQLSYAPANAFLDALATYRRRSGDNCTSIQWTCWRGVGLMAQNPSATQMITKGMIARGFDGVSKDEALEALEAIVRSSNRDQVAVVRALDIEPDEPVRHPMLRHITCRTEAKASTVHTDYPENAIAVVGLACRTAAGETADDLWEAISTGKSMERELDETRFPDIKNHPDKMWGNFMENIDCFDHRFFKKSKREAAALDPHQRVLLEAVYHALESAGEFGGGREQESEGHEPGRQSTACFIGMNAPDYPINLACNPSSPYTGFGMLRSFVAGRLSHHFGWTGPSQTIDTACSSAMVALHQACRAIQLGECTRAVAGGVNLITNTALFHALRTGGFLNPNGSCKTFDVEASGYCRGEAVGVVILKPLKAALQDGDDIMGVLLATGNNQNINNTSITNPVLESQSALYRDVLARAGVDPGEVSYVEAHGTGTRAGDPVEVQGIRQVLGGKDRRSTLHIGAVKPNIGHSEGAAGMISLIKVLLMIKHGMITPQAHFKKLNPNIAPLEPDKMAIATSLKKWHDGSRIALVNSYGASGNNAAAIVAPPPALPSDSSSPATKMPLPTSWPIFISADSESSLRNYCAKLKDHVEKASFAPDMGPHVAFELATRQNRRLQNVFSTTITSLGDMKSLLSDPGECIVTAPKNPKPIVLLFSGQNGNTVNPVQALYDGSCLFRAHIDRCEGVVQSMGLPSILPAVLKGLDGDADLVLRHAAMFAIQYSSGMAWIDSGVKPQAICGHSFGEWAALTVSGALTLRAGMQLVTGRASIIQRLWGEDTGSMVAIEDDFVGTKLSPDEYLEPFREKHPTTKLEVACHNGPNNYVIAGSTADITVLESWLVDKKKSNQKLRFKVLKGMYAYHSAMADPIVEESGKLSASIEFREPKCPFESCHKDPWTGPGINVVARNTRGAVYFAQAIARIVDRLGPSTFLEAGFGGPIIAMAQKALPEQAQQQTFVAVGNKDLMRSLADATTALWTCGLTDVQFWPFHRSQRSSYVPVALPPYQFERTSHWLDYTGFSSEMDNKSTDVEKTAAPAALCSNCSAKTQIPYITIDRAETQGTDRSVFRIDPRSDRYKDLVAGHAVVGSPICPAAMYLELAAHGVALLLDIQRSYGIPEIGANELTIKAPLGLDELRSVQLILNQKTGSSWRFELCSSKDNMSLTHATGTISLLTGDDRATLDDQNMWARILRLRDDADSEALRGAMVYKIFSTMANYSVPYRGLRHLIGKGAEGAGEILMPTAAIDLVTRAPNSKIADTLIMDNFLQVPGAFVHSLRPTMDGLEDGSMSYICTGMGEVRPLNRLRGSGKYRAYTKVVREGDKEVALDVFAFDEETREIIWSCRNLTFTKIPRSSLARSLAAANPAMDLKAPAAMPSERIPVASEARGNPPAQARPDSQSGLDPSGHVQDALNEWLDGKNSHASKEPTTFKEESASKTSDVTMLSGVSEVLSQSLDIPSESITTQSALEDLGVDSLIAPEILSKITGKFHVDLSMDALAPTKDVKSLCNSISAAGGGSAVGDDADASQGPVSTPSDTDGAGDDTLPKVKEILCNSLHVEAEEISPDSNLENLGLDSLVAVEIRNSLNATFGCNISPDELTSTDNVASLCTLMTGDVSTDDSSLSTRSNSSLPGIDIATPPSDSDTTSVDFEQTLPPHGSDIPFHEAFQSIRRNFDTHAKTTKLLGYWDDVYPQQLVAVTAFIVEAFETLGCPIENIQPGERLPALNQTLAKYDREVARLWDILEEAGIAEKAGQHYVRGQTALPSKPAKQLSAELISDFPQFASTHGLPDLLGPHLADSLVGKAEPTTLLFGNDRGREFLADFYANGPDLRACTDVLCDFVRAAVQSCTQNGEPFRVLEIGAGTGGTTKLLIPLLQESGVRFEYTFTELSGSLLARARGTTFKGIAGMDFRKLDVEQEPPADLLGRYHLAISSNCVHATRNLQISLKNIRKMLRPNDGCVALVELTAKLAWYDLVWGLLDGWWLFDDGREYALQSPWAWEKAMTDAGFAHVDWSESASRESRSVRLVCGMVQEVDRGIDVKAKSIMIHRGNPSSAHRNLFLCPDGFGNGAVFRGLSPSLRVVENVSVYALSSPFIHCKYDADKPPAIEELAGIYVAEIKRRQPVGPYMLGGYSFGGLVAYEAARQLLEVGDEVEKLFLIDVACPTFAASMPESLANFMDSTNEGVGQGQRLNSEHFNLSRQQLAAYRWSPLPSRKVPRAVLFSARSGVTNQDTGSRPEVRSSEQDISKWFLDDRPDGPLGWDELLGDVQVFRADGNHFSMMSSTYVESWASKLADVLNKSA